MEMGRRRRARSVHFPGQRAVWVLGCEKVGSPALPPPPHLQGCLDTSQCLLAGQVQPLPGLPSTLSSAGLLQFPWGQGQGEGGTGRPLGERLTPEAVTNPELSWREGELLLSLYQPVPHIGFQVSRAGGRALWAGAQEGLGQVA